MVTGDQQLIGIETARQLGMGTNIYKIGVLLEVRSLLCRAKDDSIALLYASNAWVWWLAGS